MVVFNETSATRYAILRMYHNRMGTLRVRTGLDYAGEKEM